MLTSRARVELRDAPKSRNTPDHSVQRCTVTPTPSSALCGAENAASARPLNQLAQRSETCQCSGAGELSCAPYHAEILYRPYTVCERGKCRGVGTAYAELDGEGLDVPSQVRRAMQEAREPTGVSAPKVNLPEEMCSRGREPRLAPCMSSCML